MLAIKLVFASGSSAYGHVPRYVRAAMARPLESNYETIKKSRKRRRLQLNKSNLLALDNLAYMAANF